MRLIRAMHTSFIAMHWQLSLLLFPLSASMYPLSLSSKDCTLCITAPYQLFMSRTCWDISSLDRWLATSNQRRKLGYAINTFSLKQSSKAIHDYYLYLSTIWISRSTRPIDECQIRRSVLVSQPAHIRDCRPTRPARCKTMSNPLASQTSFTTSKQVPSLRRIRNRVKWHVLNACVITGFPQLTTP